MKLMLVFVRRYPGQSLFLVLALLLAGVAEGIGFSALLPLLNLALEGAVTAGDNDFAKFIARTFTDLGLTPSIGVLLSVIVVVITASGSVSKRMVEFEDAVDPGLAEWARAYLEETVVGRRASANVLRRAFEDPGLTTRERFFLAVLRPAFAEIAAQTTELYVGGAASLLGDARGAELEACQRLLEVLERRAAVLGLLQEALDPDRTVVRVGPELEGEELRGAAYVGTTYGLPNRSLGAVGLLGPLRMDYDKAIRAVRAAAFELSRLVDDVYGPS